MKTPDEIKKVLECRSRALNDECNLECKSCDVYVRGRFSEFFKDALAYIELLEGSLEMWKAVASSPGAVEDMAIEIDRLTQRLAQAEEALAFERAYREDQAVAGELKCSLLEREAEQAERERDACIKDLDEALNRDGLNDCYFCKHKLEKCPECNWEWRGVCEENSR